MARRREREQPMVRAVEETAPATPVTETPEAGGPEVWVCPKCSSSYRVTEEAVAIINHKAWHGVT